MNSYDFEKVAKNAVIKILKEDYDIHPTIKEMQVVWFTHCLGYKKCCLYAPCMKAKYAEVTYNREKDELYVDIYIKDYNKKIPFDEFDLEAKEEIK